MKAYKAWGIRGEGSTIVFAENVRQAKRYALSTETCEDARFIDVRVCRYKEADCLYKGKQEIDWYDMETRILLIKDFGWSCLDTSFECGTCKAKKYCGWFEDSEVKECEE